jgi:hypothetical protein
MADLYLHSHICIHGIVLNYTKYEIILSDFHASAKMAALRITAFLDFTLYPEFQIVRKYNVSETGPASMFR